LEYLWDVFQWICGERLWPYFENPSSALHGKQHSGLCMLMDVEFWTAFKIAGSQKILKTGI
jgi:hypothetical protein